MLPRFKNPYRKFLENTVSRRVVDQQFKTAKSNVNINQGSSKIFYVKQSYII